jgi:Peptidase family M23
LVVAHVIIRLRYVLWPATIALALLVITPTVALADNCSSLHDCWRTVGAAATSAAAAGVLAAVAAGLLNGRRNEVGPERRTGKPGGGRLGNDDSATAASSGSPGQNGPAPADDPPDVPQDQSSPADNLTGWWTQDGVPGTFVIDRAGTSVRAQRGQPWVCLPGGPAPAEHGNVSGGQTNDVHFEGTLDGDRLTGQIAICWFGNGEEAYWAPAPLDLSLNSDGDQLVGTWRDDQQSQTEAVTLARQPFQPLTAEDFGLPAGNLRAYDYGITKAQRKDGTIASVPPDYVLVPDVDDAVVLNRGIDFTSRNDNWVVDTLPFASPVVGTVHLYPNSPWNTIGLRLDPGDWLQFLHASEISVQEGERVEAGTILGKTGATGTTVIHLHVQAKNARGDVDHPDAVVARVRNPSGSPPVVGDFSASR